MRRVFRAVSLLCHVALVLTIAACADSPATLSKVDRPPANGIQGNTAHIDVVRPSNTIYPGRYFRVPWTVTNLEDTAVTVTTSAGATGDIDIYYWTDGSASHPNPVSLDAHELALAPRLGRTPFVNVAFASRREGVPFVRAVTNLPRNYRVKSGDTQIVWGDYYCYSTAASGIGKVYMSAGIDQDTVDVVATCTDTTKAPAGYWPSTP